MSVKFKGFFRLFCERFARMTQTLVTPTAETKWCRRST